MIISINFTFLAFFLSTSKALHNIRSLLEKVFAQAALVSLDWLPEMFSLH